MKKICILILAGLSISMSRLCAEKKDSLIKKEQFVIEVSCALTVAGEIIKDYYVFLYSDGKLIDSFSVTKKKSAVFELECGGYYCLRYSKNGYDDKLIMLDGRIPDPHVPHPYYSVEFDIELHHTKDEIKKDYLDFPVALIRYDKKDKEFTYSNKYHKQIRY